MAEAKELIEGAVEFAVDERLVLDHGVQAFGDGDDVASGVGGFAGDAAGELSPGAVVVPAILLDGAAFEPGGTGQAPVADGEAFGCNGGSVGRGSGSGVARDGTDAGT